MNVYISVISHNHAQMIIDFDCLRKLAKKYKVIIKNNSERESIILNDYCRKNGIHIIDNNYNTGFGKNNNIVFQFCREELEMATEDYFILINPDVIIDDLNIDKLISVVEKDMVDISGISLYKDDSLSIRDYSIRNYPSFYTFFMSFFRFSKKYCVLPPDDYCSSLDMDWVAGSFMAFKTKAYSSLLGFDEHYFMYCEDLDICYRAKNRGMNLKYIPSIVGIHKAQHNNRRVFSKHFYWHVKSAIRFLVSKKIKLQVKSILK
ncbi:MULTISPECIES: glycosyltransferase [Citrobacter freundii complex]|nr:glycosyltransferase family 2 protein [Citrobacter portucalensis]ALD79255.1 putative glycosyl transferase [Citrobacter portucalensis]MBD9983791.1 glycosyltransferase family 2 protein [Citrobacter portucalensis]MBE0035351.1 glycosyltransferase family 2 protein [Citrobacter portucalensis]MBE0038969.1 glycosyltransferase family 2 protein [Citrobacter portucalensis]MBE0043813.1 glycosyltransferase family 2 protein [Citrobacter portucalensis]